jgi:predicted nuclease of restriction endonuclease-like (RecB) superfamily
MDEVTDIRPIDASLSSSHSPERPPAAECLARIRDVLRTARHHALMSVNAAMVQAYWHVGREIVEEEQRGKDRAVYGSRLIEDLARDLTTEFGKGFGARSLWFMRDFYVAFPILNALRSELSWTHYRLLARVQKEEARRFYVVECVKARWSTRELERQINSLLYERLALSRDKEGLLALAEQGHEPFTPADLVKDPYVLEFVGLPERTSHHESDLEQALMDRLQSFLLELGRGFFFVARQKRLTIDGDHFYIDLVFYHRTLRCFVLIDLKVGKLTQQDIGQMLLYTGYYEKEETAEGENPPIGLILCTDKNDAVVRYTLSGTTQQIFASRYQLFLPTEEELRDELLRERHLLERERAESTAE